MTRSPGQPNREWAGCLLSPLGSTNGYLASPCWLVFGEARPQKECSSNWKADGKRGTLRVQSQGQSVKGMPPSSSTRFPSSASSKEAHTPAFEQGERGEEGLMETGNDCDVFSSLSLV